MGNVEGMSQGGRWPSLAWGPSLVGTSRTLGMTVAGWMGVSVESTVLAKDTIFEQTAILGALLPLQGLWIFHEVMAWASHSLGPPSCRLLHWWNKAPIQWLWRLSVLIVCTSLSDWAGKGGQRTRLPGRPYNSVF